MPVKIEWLQNNDVVAYRFFGAVTMSDMLALAEQETILLARLPSHERKNAIFDFTGMGVLNVTMIPLLGKLAPVKDERLHLIVAVADNSYSHALVTGLSIMLRRSLPVRETLEEAYALACALAQDSP